MTGADPALPSRACAVTGSGPVVGEVLAPASKSVTNRVLIAAALASGTSVLRDPLVSDDSRVMAEAVAAFGADVRLEAGQWTVAGTGGRLRTPELPVDAGLSGTTMRFVAALATLAPRASVVTGLPPLLARPVGPLVEGLRALGAQVSDEDGFPPVRAAGGGLRGGTAVVDASRSSQFASGVLLVAPYAERDVTVEVRDAGADDYIALTAAVMRDWGAQVEQRARGLWHVAAGAGYQPRETSVEYDASAAAHLFALAMATGGRVTVGNVREACLQPDADILSLFAAMGGTVERDGARVTVTGPTQMEPIDADLSRMPDQVTTMAVLAALAGGTSVLRDVGVARTHETDRLAALARELAKVGVRVEESPDSLRIHGGSPAGPACLDTHDDHRLAMAFAALGAAVDGIVIAEPWCVSKTYPAFWSVLRGLGVQWHEVGG